MVTFLLVIGAVVAGTLLMTAVIAGAVTLVSSGFVALAAWAKWRADRSGTAAVSCPAVPFGVPEAAVGPPGPHWAR
ncbi:MAG: hypothetical protein M0Z30_16730 [Actinomycetota bacterium]|nr:hypothetical protein [Actinomycetota bacterium]